MTSQELKRSMDQIGQLYPILTDHYGNIIDGKHRLSVDEKWKKIRLEHIKTEKDRLIARIVSNNVRRIVSGREKTELLSRLGGIYLNEGVELGRIAHKIADVTGMSYRWVIKYIPERFKDSLQSERASSAAHRAAETLEELLRPSKRKWVIMIKNYANADFVSLIVERDFFEEFERDSLELGVSIEVSVLKALEDYRKRMRKAITLKKRTI